MDEIWKDIDGFSNYQVSNYGRIKSKERIVKTHCAEWLKPERVLKTNIMKVGYKSVVLRDDAGKKHLLKIHRLVAKAFIPNPHNYPQVNHIDGDKANPVVTNLEWCTPKQNAIHAIETGLKKRITGRNIQKIYRLNASFDVEAIYENLSDAESKTGISKSSIYYAMKEKRSYNECFYVRENDYKKGIDYSEFRISTPNIKLVECDGEMVSLSEYGRRMGVNRATAYSRMKRGWPFDEAFSQKQRW